METTRTMRPALNKEWTVGTSIGDGGFGAVYEAENTTGEKAAVKLCAQGAGHRARDAVHQPGRRPQRGAGL